MPVLDYKPTKEVFTLEGNDILDKAIADTCRNVGLDWSVPSKCWYTRTPYAAYHFWPYATERATAELTWMHIHYRASWSTNASRQGLVVPADKDLMDFQAAGVRHVVDRGGGLIGDDRGLGKTVQGIVAANTMRARRVLVICPGKARRQWEKEVKRWAVHPDGRRVNTYVVGAGKDGLNPGANYIIISYDLAAGALRDRLIEFAPDGGNWDMLLVDEAHNLKNPTTKRTRAILGNLQKPSEPCIAQRCNMTVGMTGTYLPNRPREAYTLARHLDWDAIDRLSEQKFRERFNPSASMPNGFVVEKAGRLPELHYRLRCNFMVRRRKEDVLDQLPELRLAFTYVDQDGKVQQALEAERQLDIDTDQLGRQTDGHTGHVAQVRREMGEAKAPLEVSRAKELLDTDVQTMFIAVNHRSVSTILAEGLKDYGVDVIDGRTSDAGRQRAERNMASGKTRVLIGQIQAAGEALDGFQHHCSWIDILEPSWVPGQNEQVIDRLRRIGQTAGAVNANFVLAPGSKDEDVVRSHLQKLETTDIVLEGYHE